jgi:hypothetical protein
VIQRGGKNSGKPEKIVVIWILLVLGSAMGRKSGGSASLLGRTPKARASRQFLRIPDLEGDKSEEIRGN